MPHAFVLHLHPECNLFPSDGEGRHLHALFLDLMRQADPAVAEGLHGEAAVRPFTVGPLRPLDRDAGRAREQGEGLPAGTPCALRVTLLEDGLFAPLSRLFLTGSPCLRLGQKALIVSRLLATSESGAPGVGIVSYRDLEEGAGVSRHIALRFLSPTAFRDGDHDLPLPVPALAFGSYLRRWDALSGRPMPEDTAEAIRRHVMLSGFDRLRPVEVRDQRSRGMGFVGRAFFEMDPKAGEGLVRRVNALADFAFFCGTGKKTTMGMGQTMRERRGSA